MFYRKTHIQEILNFWAKSWVNPFAKMPIFFSFFLNALFLVQKGLFYT